MRAIRAQAPTLMEMALKIELMGGHRKVARRCGITRQAVMQWREVPARFVLLLADQSPLTPHEIRPDLYPHPLDGTRGRAKRRAAPPQ